MESSMSSGNESNNSNESDSVPKQSKISIEVDKTNKAGNSTEDNVGAQVKPKLKRRHPENNKRVNMKRRKVQRVPRQANRGRQIRQIVARLNALEKSQSEFQKQQMEILAGILASLERQHSIEQQLSNAFNRIANFLDVRVGQAG